MAVSPELDDAFADEVAATNGRRLRVLLPLIAVGHVVHVAVFRTTGAERAALDPIVRKWRDGVALTHTATLAIALLLTAFMLHAGRERPPRSLGPLTALVYLVHGAFIAGVDQLQVTGVTPFIGYCLGVAVTVALTPRVAIALYAIALATFVGSISAFQASASARLAILPNGFSIVVVSVTLAWLFFLARRRDFTQRRTIETQQRELTRLNADLERRVQEQVAEIVARAEQVERLNAQLQAQVRARSTELSMALAKLARQREVDGTLRRGLVLGGRFEVDEILGQGGMGAVYSGTDRSTGERVAIKVIQASSSQQLDALHRFLREAGAAATVDHPAVVKMLHVDVSDDGMLFQVQELVDGVTLQSRLRRGRRWDPRVVARCVAVLCDALATAHARGIVHRDVKPANVMLTDAPPGLKLLDFGISKLWGDTQGADDATQTGVVLGTPAYMAPEQVDGARDVGDRADVYAVGVMLFLMLSGKLPFDDATPRAMITAHVVVPAPDVRAIEPSVPPRLADLVAACLRKSPAERPTAREVERALRAFADERGAPPLDVLAKTNDLYDVDAAAIEHERTAVAGKPTPNRSSSEPPSHA